MGKTQGIYLIRSGRCWRPKNPGISPPGTLNFNNSSPRGLLPMSQSTKYSESGRDPSQLADGELNAFEKELYLKHQAMDTSGEGITIADVRLPDMPIIYVNAAFYRMTGYTTQDIIGRNCRFLQGAETEVATVEEIRVALRQKREITVEILNYRKNGSPFWNRLTITPIQDAAGKVTHFVGVQSDVTRRKQAEEELRRVNAILEAANLRMKRELDTAAKAQMSLLPDRVPEVAGIQASWAFRPCNELAGDSFNLFALDDRQLGIYILDVVGHGVCAALQAVMLSRLLSPGSEQSSLVRNRGASSTSSSITSPAEVVFHLNQRFFAEQPANQCYTLLYGILDLSTHEFCYASAGHTQPILTRNNKVTAILESSGFPVGYLEEAEYEERVVQLRPGDRLYLYTDGVLDAGEPTKEPFGVERMVALVECQHVEPIDRSVNNLMTVLQEWCNETGFSDDVSVVALELMP